MHYNVELRPLFQNVGGAVQCCPMELFITLYKVVLILSLDEILTCNHVTELL